MRRGKEGEGDVRKTAHTMSGLESLVAKDGRPAHEPVSTCTLWEQGGWAQEAQCVLEGYPILRHMLIARLPDESDVAGIRRL